MDIPENIKFINTKLEYKTKLIHKDRHGGARVYKDAILLTPGEWSDAVTKAPVLYSSHEIKKSASNWERDRLNVNHSWFVEDQIGYVRNTYFSDDKLKGDLYIYPITNRARDTIALIDAKLVNDVSVEVATRDEWDTEKGMRIAKDLLFFGLAVVTDGACSDARIK